MTQQKRHNQDSSLCVSAPSCITLARLRNHFRQKYRLSEPQVETMVVSSSKSLKQGLENLKRFLAGDKSVEGPAAIYHGFKGLFLNMGEAEWAAFTKDIEQKLSAGEQLDHSIIAGILRQGSVEILSYVGLIETGLLNGE
ncbi:MAG: hypothetical protein V2B20_17960 [Pseudomonadota bacterium]